jgi:hypothetical protein
VKTADVLIAVAVLVTIISVVCIWFYPSVQDFMAANTLWNGVRDFSHESGAQNIDSLDELPALPEEKALLSIPTLAYSDEELIRIRDFVSHGGRLVLMDDYGYGNQVLEALGLDVRFTNIPLLDPLFCYKSPWLPKIMDFAPELGENGVEMVVLNHATCLQDVAESEVLAWSSSSSFLDFDESETRTSDEPMGPFPVAAKMKCGKGTVMLVSDPSILINSMVRRGDNRSFAAYLVGPGVEEEKVLVDRSSLAKAQLDESKVGLVSLHRALSEPYSLLGLVVIVFAVASKYTLKKGEGFD